MCIIVQVEKYTKYVDIFFLVLFTDEIRKESHNEINFTHLFHINESKSLVFIFCFAQWYILNFF